MTALIFWVDSDLGRIGDMEWRCHCDAELVIEWSTSHVLLDTDEAIGPDHPITAHWKLTCHNGHTLVLAHELSDDSASDCYPPPTTDEIARAIAGEEDLAAWRTYRDERKGP